MSHADYLRERYREVLARARSRVPAEITDAEIGETVAQVVRQARVTRRIAELERRLKWQPRLVTPEERAELMVLRAELEDLDA